MKSLLVRGEEKKVLFFKVGKIFFTLKLLELSPDDVLHFSARRGFQGVIKRWGFSGGPSDERGSTKFHRRPGCIGSGREKARVWPGQKLPGHVGGNRVKMIGLQIMRINYEHNILYIRGTAIPGEPGEFVQIFDSKILSKYVSL